MTANFFFYPSSPGPVFHPVCLQICGRLPLESTHTCLLLVGATTKETSSLIWSTHLGHTSGPHMDPSSQHTREDPCPDLGPVPLADRTLSTHNWTSEPHPSPPHRESPQAQLGGCGFNSSAEATHAAGVSCGNWIHLRCVVRTEELSTNVLGDELIPTTVGRKQ